jgi:hypothetical protein
MNTRRAIGSIRSCVNRAKAARQVRVGGRPRQSWSVPPGVNSQRPKPSGPGHCTKGINSLVRAHEPVNPFGAHLALPRELRLPSLPGCRAPIQAMVRTPKATLLFSLDAGWSLRAIAGIRSACSAQVETTVRSARTHAPALWACVLIA